MQQAKYYWMDFLNECQIKIHIDYATWRKQYGGYFYEVASVAKQVPPPINFANGSCIKRYDFLSSGAIDIFSEELANFLKDKIDVEFIPIMATLKGEPYSERTFYLVHMMDRRYALDMEHSVYTQKISEKTGELMIWDVEQVVLDNVKAGNSPAFFLNKPAKPVFREDIAKGILAQGFKGIRFVPIEMHNPGKWPDDITPYLLQP
jgi:hypothetical protein